MTKWNETLRTLYSGPGEMLASVADRLASTVRIRPKNFSGLMEEPDLMQTIRQSSRRRRALQREVEAFYKQGEVPLTDVVRAIRKIRADRSTRVLVELLERSAVDEKAKQYWEEYMGEYGKALTREFEEVLDDSKIKVARLLDWRGWFVRNYGAGCRAVDVLDFLVGRKGD